MDSKIKPTEDVHPDWLNIIRAIQAACTTNNGLAVISIAVAVAGNDPVGWFEPEVARIHPMRLAKAKFTPKIASALLAMTDHKTRSLPKAAEGNTIDTIAAKLEPGAES